MSTIDWNDEQSNFNFSINALYIAQLLVVYVQSAVLISFYSAIAFLIPFNRQHLRPVWKDKEDSLFDGKFTPLI
jgi:hypothetical protein